MLCEKILINGNTELFRVAVDIGRTGRKKNAIRVVVASDTHYFWPSDDYFFNGLGGRTTSDMSYHCRAERLVENLLAEWRTDDSFDALILNGDLTFNDPIFKGKHETNAVEEFNRLYLSRLRAVGIPVFAVYGGHDFTGDDEWRDIFGHGKNYILEIGDTAFVCCDTFNFEHHKRNNPNYRSVETEEFQKIADIPDDFLRDALAYLDTGAASSVFVVAHWESSSENFKRLSQDARVTGRYLGHGHYTYIINADNGISAQTGHHYFSGCVNLNHSSNGFRQYVPYAVKNPVTEEESVAALYPVDGVPYYTLKSMTRGNGFVDVNVKTDGRYLPTVRKDGITYHLFARYEGEEGLTYIYKDDVRRDGYGGLYAADENVLVPLLAHAFSEKVNTLCYRLRDIVLDSAYATEEGSEVTVKVGETVQKRRDKVEYFDRADVCDAGNIYRRRGRNDLYTVDCEGYLVKIYDLSPLRLETDGKNGAVYFEDKDGNRAMAPQSGESFAVAVTEELYCYIPYGAVEIENETQDVYKNNKTTELYLRERDGKLRKIKSYSHEKTPLIRRFADKEELELSVTGNPWCFRIHERVVTKDADHVESYVVYPAEKYGSMIWGGAAYHPFTQTYMRTRPSDMGGYHDRAYIIWKRFK